jgi:choline dehydrogenase-like flavoprotein
VGLQIARQNALVPFTETVYQSPASDSDADLRAYARRHAQTLFHPTGTCAMGEVVDADLRVIGADGLRVVDASVMPVIVRGNPNAPIIALAERAADLIRGKAPVPVMATA